MDKTNMRLSGKLIIICCFLAALSAASAVAQKYPANAVDSLNRLASSCYERQEYTLACEYSRQAMEICRKAGDMEGFAKYAHAMGVNYFHAGLYSEALENYLTALTCRREQDNHQAMFPVYKSIGNVYHNLGYHASALQFAKEALELARVKGDTLNEALFAFYCADAYCKLSDSVSASACYDRALELYRMAGDTAQMAMTFNNMAGMFAPASAEKLNCLMEAARLYENMPLSAKTQSFLSHVYCNIGILYSATNRHDSASIYFDRAINTAHASGDRHKKVFVYTRIAEYYFMRGNTDRAKQLAQETIELIREVAGDNHTFDKTLKLLSRIYALENDHVRAYETLLKWSAVNDSVYAQTLRDEKSRIDRRYTFESHRQEQLATRKRIAERNRNYFIFAAIACIILLSGWIFHSRQMTRKNRGLYRQIREQDRLREQLRVAETPNLGVSAWQHPCTADVPAAIQSGAAGEQQVQLVARLREYLLADRHFASPDLDMTDIITAIGANRTYLFEAMKAVTGQTPQDYINSLRLEEARRLLDATGELIENIAAMSGYNTSRTFYRLFRERYNISPAEYRRMGRKQ